MKNIKINNKDVVVKPLNYRAVSQLEEMGISLTDAEYLKKNPLKFVNCAIAVLCYNGDLDLAIDEIDNHIINGGSFVELNELVIKEFEESDFFKALNRAA